MVESSSPVSSSEKEIEDELIRYGIRLIALPSNELPSILHEVETLLAQVAQAPPDTMKTALHPIMEALIGTELLTHSDEGIIDSVVLCHSEVMRITAPQPPYDDAIMKEIFQHILQTLEKLSDVKSHNYSKPVQILDNVSKVRACVMLLDLECDTLVIDMFRLFLRIIRPSHSIDVFKNMEDIMVWIIKECDEISTELLMVLLDSIKNENQKTSPASWNLGQNVLKKCSSVVRRNVVEAVKSMSLDMAGYAGILASICDEMTNEENVMENENTPQEENMMAIVESQLEATPNTIETINGNYKYEIELKTSLDWDQIEHLNDSESPTDLHHHRIEDTQAGTNPCRRSSRRVVKSLRNYDTPTKAKPKRGSTKKEQTLRNNDKKSLGGDSGEDVSTLQKNDNLSKKTAKTSNKKAAYGEELVGSKIKVWWPLDSQFYEGKIVSFDHAKKKHKVVYDDGDEETLNLGRERWEMIKELQSDKDCEAASPVTPVPSPTEGRKKRKENSSREQTSNVSDRPKRNVRRRTIVDAD